MPRPTTIHVDQKFGRLVVVDLLDGRDGNGNKRWLCRCNCGNLTIVSTTNLNSKNTISCGCARKDNPGASPEVLKKAQQLGAQARRKGAIND